MNNKRKIKKKKKGGREEGRMEGREGGRNLCFTPKVEQAERLINILRLPIRLILIK
jgi:predicted transposase YdaD